MSDVDTLLPNNATPEEVALDLTTSRLGAVDVPVGDLWDPQKCPANLLPWLAWALSVDEWDPAWPEQYKRATIAASVAVHRRKGTRKSVDDALTAAGYPDGVVIENDSQNRYDSTYQFDATITHEDAGHWAEYRVVMQRPISIAQAAQVRRILDSVAPVRSHLVELDFTEALHLYDAQIAHDGTFTHGVA